MFDRYREILSLPGALNFALAGLVARFPTSMVAISTVLMIRLLYGNYALAGLISGVSVGAFALGAPVLARLVDRYGQAQVMIPAQIISAAAQGVLTFAAMNQAPTPVLVAAALIGGGSAGSMGALVRARWVYITKRPAQIQAAYSLESAFDEIAFIIGPILGTLAATGWHPAAGLWISIAAGLGGGLWFLGQTRTQPPVLPRGTSRPGAGIEDGEAKPAGAPARSSVMLQPAMLVLVATFVAVGTIFGANDLAVVAFTEAHGAPRMAGILLAIMATGSLIGALVYGARDLRLAQWKLFGIGVLVLALGCSTFILAHSLWALGLIMALTGVAIAPTLINVNTIVLKMMPLGRLTEGLTWLSTGMNVGVALGAATSGPLVDANGAHGGFLVVIAASWAMVLLMLMGLPVLRRDGRRLGRRPR